VNSKKDIGVFGCLNVNLSLSHTLDLYFFFFFPFFCSKKLIARLVEMGFSEADAREALRATSGNFDAAAALLLGEQVQVLVLLFFCAFLSHGKQQQESEDANPFLGLLLSNPTIQAGLSNPRVLAGSSNKTGTSRFTRFCYCFFFFL
jgi:hypothetical protein